MHLDTLQTLLRTQPFRPFDIHLADGRSIPVEHPEFVARTPHGRTVVVVLPDESFEFVDTLLVTSLKPRGNGKRRRNQ